MKPQGLKSFSRDEFDEFRELIRSVSGIALGESKDALLSSRVARRMRELGITDHGSYLDVVKSDPMGDEVLHLIDAVSTNVTSFFREPDHFVALAQHLEKLGTERSRMSLWSAACATGEEPYSMAMVALDTVPDAAHRVRILATDISGAAIDHARLGRYETRRVDSLPAGYRERFLVRSGTEWEVRSEVKRLVTLTRINLSSTPFPMSGPFDVIMCRNVMIYFAVATRVGLISEIERLLAPGGLLMLGHAESLTGIPSSLSPAAAAVYRKSERAL